MKAASATTGTMRPTRQYSVLIVDDHPIVRHGLAQLIDDGPRFNVCGQTACASEALTLVQRLKPDVMVVDLSLEGGNGLELIKQVKAQGLDTRMLVSSMHDEMLYAERSLRAGAMGYINKEQATDKIVEAINQILEGRIYLSEPMTERVLHRMMRKGHDADSSPIQSLSDRELEVFEMIGKGLTTQQIARKLHLSPKTVETHREHIKSKLDLKNNNELVRHAVQWVLENQ